MASAPNNIATLRKKLELSQQALADAIGAHWTTISKLERGRIKLTTDWLYKIAAALEVPPAALLTDNDDAPPPVVRHDAAPTLPAAFQVLIRCLEENGALRKGQFQDALQRYLFAEP